MAALLVVRMIVRRVFEMPCIMFAHDLEQPRLGLAFMLQTCEKI